MLLLLVAVPLALALQPTPATISGEVRRADTGEPIAGVVVAAPDLGRETRTDTRGRYALSSMPAGPWHLTVRGLGFAPRTLHTLVPRAGVLELDVTMTPVPQRLAGVIVRQTVVARSGDDSARVDFPNRVVHREQINTYPLSAERDPLVALGGGEVSMRPEMPSGLHIRGAGADQTAYRLDGIPVLNPLHAGGMISTWEPDAIATARVVTVPDDSRTLAVGGVVSATTRDVSRESGTGSTSVGTTQVRVTLHGALGADGGNFLFGVRSNAPSNAVARREGSYLRSEASDAITKVELPLFRGRLRVLDVRSDDEISAAALVPAEAAPVDPRRNLFEWGGRSSGIAWSRATARGTVRVSAWNATMRAAARWGAADAVGQRQLLNTRRDDGVSATGTRETSASTSNVGVSLERSATLYDARVTGSTSMALQRRVVMASLFANRAQSLSRAVRVNAGASATAVSGRVVIDPRAGIRWSPVPKVTLTTDAARLHQFTQSLRNDESVVGTIFPVELFVNAGSGGVPIAVSDVVVFGIDSRPASGIRMAVQAFSRLSRGLALAAPHNSEPFVTGSVVVGGSRARGASLELSASGARASAQAVYGLQRVRYAANGAEWIPQFSTAQTLEGGMTVFPTPTFSINVGAIGGWGRRATPVIGAFEWESCNLRDRGCEFGGTPRAASEVLGTLRLPAYVRVDVGVRKHWHATIGARPVELSLFGTVSNLGNYRSVLTRAIDPVTRVATDIRMRPQAPLVIGLDWRF